MAPAPLEDPLTTTCMQHATWASHFGAAAEDSADSGAIVDVILGKRARACMAREFS